MAQTANTILYPRWLIPVEPPGQTLEQHAVVTSGGRIEAVLPASQARTEYENAQHVELPEHALIPGLINLHTHAAMTLLRGLADDQPLMQWLTQHIWPAEAKHVSPQFVYDGTLLACAEMLRGGVTCMNDMYFFPEAAARAALAAGMRASIGMIAIEFASSYAADAEDYLHKGMATRDEFRGEPSLSFCFAPHAPYTISDHTFERILTYAEQLDVPIHTHLHETQDEIQQSLQQHHVRPIARLKNLGLLGPNLIAVHAVHLEPGEIALLAQHGVHVAHCPSSNLKLASGIAPVAALRQAGVNVGIGTDGAASNNRLDMFEEMRLAALLAKAVSGDAAAVPAARALRMATIDAARALGLDASIGSIAAGKSADLTAVNLARIETSPCYDVVSQLVYAASRECVSHVWVQGELLVAEGRLTRLDESALRAGAARWAERIRVE
jgi:5-methylthioadenosine/S-adenosylhomocysteine deaminase